VNVSRHYASDVGLCSVRSCTAGITPTGRITRGHLVVQVDLGSWQARLCDHHARELRDLLLLAVPPGAKPAKKGARSHAR
jgi:hypothetical protein